MNGMEPCTLPEDAVEVGRVQEAWGIKGWVRLHAFSESADVLLRTRDWVLAVPEGRYGRGFTAFEGTVSARVAEVKPHSDGLVAKFDSVDDRTDAESLKSARILVSRSLFPAPAHPDEYYWVDLLGLRVVNREGVELGTVRELLPTGPHAVLCLEQQEGERTVERMIPFVAAYIDSVDRATGVITADWQPDY